MVGLPLKLNLLLQPRYPREQWIITHKNICSTPEPNADVPYAIYLLSKLLLQVIFESGRTLPYRITYHCYDTLVQIPNAGYHLPGKYLAHKLCHRAISCLTTQALVAEGPD